MSPAAARQRPHLRRERTAEGVGALTPGAERQRRSRARRAAGSVLLMVRCDEAALTDRLTRDGLLDWSLADDKASIAHALEKLVELYIEFGVGTEGDGHA